MSNVIFVPRAFGGTIIYTPPAPLPSTVPVLLIVATFRDGSQPAQYRDGQVTAGGR